MVRRANKRARNHKKRLEKSIVLIALEGNNKTERDYFRGFNHDNKRYRIVFAHGNNTDPVNIVKDAVSSFQKYGLEESAGDHAYAIFDTDFNKQKQISEARRIANEKNISLLLSNPSFEIWLLLHFRYSTKPYGSNSELINELRQRWPNYDKSIGTFDEIADRLSVAIDNAKQLKRFHKSNNASDKTEDCNPSTDVNELVELLACGRGDCF